MLQNVVKTSIPFTLVDFIRLSNLIELRNFGYKIKVCNLICCVVSRGERSLSFRWRVLCVLNMAMTCFRIIKECCRYLKLVTHSLRSQMCVCVCWIFGGKWCAEQNVRTALWFVKSLQLCVLKRFYAELRQHCTVLNIVRSNRF